MTLSWHCAHPECPSAHPQQPGIPAFLSLEKKKEKGHGPVTQPSAAPQEQEHNKQRLLAVAGSRLLGAGRSCRAISLSAVCTRVCTEQLLLPAPAGFKIFFTKDNKFPLIASSASPASIKLIHLNSCRLSQPGLHKENCSGATQSCHRAGNPSPSSPQGALCAGKPFGGWHGAAPSDPPRCRVTTLLQPPSPRHLHRRAWGSNAELCWAPRTLQDMQQLKWIPQSAHLLQVTKPLSPAVPPHAGNPRAKHTPRL